MIVGYDENTLGKRGSHKEKLVTSTKMFLRCDNCGEKEWRTTYGNYLRRKISENYCRACKNTLGIGGFKGKKHTVESRAKISEKISGENNVSKRPEVRAKLSSIFKGRDNYWSKGKKRPEHSARMKVVIGEKWKDPVFRENMISKLTTRFSKFHTHVKGFLETTGYEFVSEKLIRFYHVDECCDELMAVIESNGKYWHADPRVYSSDAVLAGGKSAKFIWGRDKGKVSFLNNNGYSVFTVWEMDWNKNQKSVEAKINQWLDKLSLLEYKTIINGSTYNE